MVCKMLLYKGVLSQVRSLDSKSFILVFRVDTARELFRHKELLANRWQSAEPHPVVHLRD
jgi:hypothetical protein